jgi:hypothetical protein
MTANPVLLPEMALYITLAANFIVAPWEIAGGILGSFVDVDLTFAAQVII